MSSTASELSPLVLSKSKEDVNSRSVEVPPASAEDSREEQQRGDGQEGQETDSPDSLTRTRTRQRSRAESLVLEFAHGQATETPEHAEEEEILRGYKPHTSRCMKSSQLRKHRAELLSVRDILVHGDAWMVCKLLAAENDYTCTALQHLLKASSGYKFLHKDRHEEKETPAEERHQRARDGAPMPRSGSVASLSAYSRGSRIRQLENWGPEASPTPRAMRAASAGGLFVEPPVRAGSASPNRSSRAMTLVDESVQERLQAESAEDFINRFVRPNIVTLSTINKMLEEVELAAATRDKLEITLLLWSMTAIFTLVSWLLTDVWDVDEDLVQHIHQYWVGNNATGAG